MSASIMAWVILPWDPGSLSPECGGVRSVYVLALVKRGMAIGIGPDADVGGEWGTGGSPEWILNSVFLPGFALRVLGLDPWVACGEVP